jgi:hypothetical protein
MLLRLLKRYKKGDKMSFRVGQILSDNLRSENLLTEKSFQIEDLETTNDITLNKFTDKRITSIENT